MFPDVIYQYASLRVLDNESESMSNPPDGVSGEIGAGWDLDFAALPPKLMDQVFQKSFMLRVDAYFPPPDLTSKGAREWLAIRDYPLLVDVRAGSAVKSPPPSVKKLANPPWKGGRDGTITDARDRKISLQKIAFFLGGIEVEARSYFPGERVTDATFHTIPLSKIKSITNYYVDYDRHTKMKNAPFSKVIMTDGSILELLGCRPCGWGGLDEEGRVVYYSNAQIKRIDFAQGN